MEPGLWAVVLSVSFGIIQFGWTIAIMAWVLELRRDVATMRATQVKLARMIRDVGTIADGGATMWQSGSRMSVLTELAELQHQIEEEWQQRNER
jgi:hypothetical protein